MKVICFGDSNTYGYDPRSFLGDRYGPTDRWPGCTGPCPPGWASGLLTPPAGASHRPLTASTSQRRATGPLPPDCSGSSPERYDHIL